MAKKFLYVCAGIFLLVASYHFGAQSAGAQGARSDVGRYQLFQGTFVALNGAQNAADPASPIILRIDTSTGATLRYSTGLTSEGKYYEWWEPTDHRK